MPKKSSFAETHPEIAIEWHPTLNGDLTPNRVSQGSAKKVWWKCDKGDDHEWEAIIYSRAYGRGCPICSGKKVVKSNCLSTTHPHLANQWHPTLNGDLTPNDVSHGSNKKVWWKCDKGDDHEWEASPNTRVSGSGCPCCSKYKISETNSLANTNEKLSKQWHPYLNKKLTPKEVTIGSSKKVWWKCDKGDDHEWEAIISSRINGSGCPICSGNKVVKSNCLSTTHPHLVNQWHPTLNGDLTPNDVSQGSSKKVWWKCDKGDDHEWEASPNKRAIGRGCPVCLNKKIVKSNCLSTLVPELAKQWHPSKNGRLTPYDVGPSGSKIVWWKCDKGDDHEWQSSMNNRYNLSEKKIGGCPFCSSQKTAYSTSLKKINPELAKQWHPSKNGLLRPEHINPYSNKKVWWKCDKGDDHEWEATVANRSNGDDCSVCGNITTVNSNSLKTLRPDLFKELHPTKNGNLNLEKLNAQSTKRVWWKCDKGFNHEWQAEVGYRNNNNSGCPVCLNQKVITKNSLAFTNPELAKQWHPSKNGNLTPYDFVEGSGKKVWWKCYREQNHEWKSRIVARKTSDCPFCQGSNGEKKIEKVLNGLNVAFTQQKTFEGMRYKNKLRCDFYLIDFNLVIEFNGIQHYEEIAFFGGKEGLKFTRKLDKIKKCFCIENGIDYSIIKYDEDVKTRIFEILEKYSL